MIVNYPGRTAVRLFITILLFFGIGFGGFMLVRHITGEDKLKIVTTNFIAYDAVRAATGDIAKLKMIVPTDTNFHDYQPTNEDIEAIKNADMIVYFGGKSDNWTDEIIRNNNIPAEKYVRILDYFDLIDKDGNFMEPDESEEESEEEEEEDAGQEDTKEELVDYSDYDEHIWSNPYVYYDVLYVVADAISTILPDDQVEKLDQSTSDYMDKVGEQAERFDEIAENAKDKTMVVGGYNALAYLKEDYKFKFVSLGAKCNGEKIDDEKKIAELAKQVKDQKIPAILKSEIDSSEIAEKIAKDSDAKVLDYYSGHIITKEDFESGKTFADFLEKNVDTFRDALGVEEKKNESEDSNDTESEKQDSDQA